MDVSRKISLSLFLIFIISNVGFWNYSKDIQKEWANVPNAPNRSFLEINFLGNTELAYRFYGTVLQNVGSVDGNYISLKQYDYSKLKDWFFLQDSLNSKSDFMPLLAAYYFGGINDSDRLEKVLEYLSVVGQSPEGEKWRWLGHAVYIARHVMKDDDRALELAYKLSENKNLDLADWAKQMPVYILQDQGDTELAYKIMLNLLITNVDKLHPNEVFFMKDYICNTLVKSDASLTAPDFCTNLKAP